MTVCFGFNPQETPWIVPFDRYNTLGFSFADGKISTYDIKAIPHALSKYRATSVHSDDEKRCDAFYNEMVKLGFFHEIIEPQAQHGSLLWRSDIWKRDIEKNYAAAMDRIEARQTQCDWMGGCRPKIADDVLECDWMGTCVKNSFASAKHFINCAAQAALQQAEDETPLLAGVGILLKRKTGQPPRIDYATPKASHMLLMLGLYHDIYGSPYIVSINGQPTESMTLEEAQAALSGPEGSFAELGIAGFDWSEERTSSTEPEEIAKALLKRTLTAGELMTQCGGIDL